MTHGIFLAPPQFTTPKTIPSTKPLHTSQRTPTNSATRHKNHPHRSHHRHHHPSPPRPPRQHNSTDDDKPRRRTRTRARACRTRRVERMRARSRSPENKPERRRRTVTEPRWKGGDERHMCEVAPRVGVSRGVAWRHLYWSSLVQAKVPGGVGGLYFLYGWN